MNSLITKISASLLKTEARRSEGSYYVKQNNSPNLNFCGLLFFLFEAKCNLEGSKTLVKKKQASKLKRGGGGTGKKVLLSLKVKAKGFLPTQDLLLLHIIMPSSKRSQSSNGKFYYKQEIKVKTSSYRIFDNFTLFFSRFPLL